MDINGIKLDKDIIALSSTAVYYTHQNITHDKMKIIDIPTVPLFYYIQA